MLQPYTSAELIAGVRRDCFLAASDDNWTDERILGIADDVILDQIAPRLKTTKQNWFQTLGSITLSSTTQSYDLPEEAMWSGVDAVHLRTISTGTIAGRLNLFNPQTAEFYAPQDQGQGVPGYFYTNQTQLVLNAIPDSSSASTYNLQVSYYRRPAKLVAAASLTTATVVASITLTVTTTSQPAYFTANAPDPYTSGTPYRVDVWTRTLPYTRKYANLTCSAPTITSLVFNGSTTQTQVASISPGDLISVHGTTMFPDLPAEMHPLLRRLTAGVILMAQKDSRANEYMQRAEKDFETMIRGMGNRADGTPKKLSLYSAGAAKTISRRRFGRWF